MLTEYHKTRQVEGEPHRRWFSDNFFDLIVWQNMNGTIKKFELCYDKGHNERALTWNEKNGYIHLKVDDGEGNPGRHKMAPIFLTDGYFDWKAISDKFFQASRKIDEGVLSFVHDRLMAYAL